MEPTPFNIIIITFEQNYSFQWDFHLQPTGTS